MEQFHVHPTSPKKKEISKKGVTFASSNPDSDRSTPRRRKNETRYQETIGVRIYGRFTDKKPEKASKQGPLVYNPTEQTLTGQVKGENHPRSKTKGKPKLMIAIEGVFEAPTRSMTPDPQVKELLSALSPSVDSFVEGWDTAIVFYGKPSFSKRCTLMGKYSFPGITDGLFKRIFERLKSEEPRHGCVLAQWDLKATCCEIGEEEVCDLFDLFDEDCGSDTTLLEKAKWRELEKKLKEHVAKGTTRDFLVSGLKSTRIEDEMDLTVMLRRGMSEWMETEPEEEKSGVGNADAKTHSNPSSCAPSIDAASPIQTPTSQANPISMTLGQMSSTILASKRLESRRSSLQKKGGRCTQTRHCIYTLNLQQDKAYQKGWNIGQLDSNLYIFLITLPEHSMSHIDPHLLVKEPERNVMATSRKSGGMFTSRKASARGHDLNFRIGGKDTARRFGMVGGLTARTARSKVSLLRAARQSSFLSEAGSSYSGTGDEGSNLLTPPMMSMRQALDTVQEPMTGRPSTAVRQRGLNLQSLNTVEEPMTGRPSTIMRQKGLNYSQTAPETPATSRQNTNFSLKVHNSNTAGSNRPVASIFFNSLAEESSESDGRRESRFSLNLSTSLQPDVPASVNKDRTKVLATQNRELLYLNVKVLELCRKTCSSAHLVSITDKINAGNKELPDAKFSWLTEMVYLILGSNCKTFWIAFLSQKQDNGNDMISALRFLKDVSFVKNVVSRREVLLPGTQITSVKLARYQQKIKNGEPIEFSQKMKTITEDASLLFKSNQETSMQQNFKFANKTETLLLAKSRKLSIASLTSATNRKPEDPPWGHLFGSQEVDRNKRWQVMGPLNEITNQTRESAEGSLDGSVDFLDGNDQQAGTQHQALYEQRRRNLRRGHALSDASTEEIMDLDLDNQSLEDKLLYKMRYKRNNRVICGRVLAGDPYDDIIASEIERLHTSYAKMQQEKERRLQAEQEALSEHGLTVKSSKSKAQSNMKLDLDSIKEERRLSGQPQFSPKNSALRKLIELGDAQWSWIPKRRKSKKHLYSTK